jgi:hypothetical protein
VAERITTRLIISFTPIFVPPQAEPLHLVAGGLQPPVGDSKQPENISFSLLPLSFSLFILIHHQQQTPRQFIDCIFTAGFKTAIFQPLAGEAEQGDFFAVALDGIDGVGVVFHGEAPSYFYPI